MKKPGRTVVVMDRHGNPSGGVPCPLHSSCACTQEERVEHGKVKEQQVKAAKEAKAAQKIADKKALQAAQKSNKKSKKGKPVPAPAAKAKAGKPAAAQKGSAAPAAKKTGGGIGGLVSKMLKDGESTEDILKAVKKDYPSAKTSPASVAWYRSQMRQSGELPKA